MDSAFRCTRSNVESQSTALSAVPEPMSSHNRQRSPLYQGQCRVTLYRAFCCTRSNVESQSRALSLVPGPMSSRSQIDAMFYSVFCWFSSTFFIWCLLPKLNIRDHVEQLIWYRLLEFRTIIWTSRVKMDGRPVCS